MLFSMTGEEWTQVLSVVAPMVLAWPPVILAYYGFKRQQLEMQRQSMAAAAAVSRKVDQVVASNAENHKLMNSRLSEFRELIEAAAADRVKAAEDKEIASRPKTQKGESCEN